MIWGPFGGMDNMKISGLSQHAVEGGIQFSMQKFLALLAGLV